MRVLELLLEVTIQLSPWVPSQAAQCSGKPQRRPDSRDVGRALVIWVGSGRVTEGEGETWRTGGGGAQEQEWAVSGSVLEGAWLRVQVAVFAL